MDSRELAVLSTLSNLRWLAVLCQGATLLAATAMGVFLPALPLWGAVATLAAFNVYAWAHSRGVRQVPAVEPFAHILVDVAVLAWLIAWSGGIANPFTSLFLLPIALASLALPARWIYATAAACGLGYAAAAALGKPFPHVHGPISDAFDLHLVGMVVNFVISAGVVLYFFVRLAGTLRQRDEELARLRERFARNEGIVALGTHAAAVAHELNTPLGTLTVMLEELIDQAPSATLREELQTMRTVVDDCRDRVRELAAPAQRAQGDGRFAQVDLRDVIERWSLTRPAIELATDAVEAELPSVEPAVGHLLLALLNNAADASESAGSRRVELSLRCIEGVLAGTVRDHGGGLPEPQRLPAALFESGKQGGMGVGLALSHATVERLDGRLWMEPAATEGLWVHFLIPLATPELS